MALIKITKFDAARRQLETSIRMFLREEDPIAIHTLAFAAHGVLYDIGKKRGVISLLKGNPIIKKEARKMFENMIRKAGNFLKHGRHDASTSLEFNLESNEYFLFDAAEMYQQLARKLAPNPTIPSLIVIMRGWFLLAKRDIFANLSEYQDSVELFDKFNFRADDKARFLQMERTIQEAMKHGKV